MWPRNLISTGYNNPFLASMHLSTVRLRDHNLAMDFSGIYTVEQGLSAQNPQKWANLNPLRFIICLCMFWCDIHCVMGTSSTTNHPRTLCSSFSEWTYFFTLNCRHQCQCDTPALRMHVFNS